MVQINIRISASDAGLDPAGTYRNIAMAVADENRCRYLESTVRFAFIAPVSMDPEKVSRGIEAVSKQRDLYIMHQALTTGTCFRRYGMGRGYHI